MTTETNRVITRATIINRVIIQTDDPYGSDLDEVDSTTTLEFSERKDLYKSPPIKIPCNVWTDLSTPQQTKKPTLLFIENLEGKNPTRHPSEEEKEILKQKSIIVCFEELAQNLKPVESTIKDGLVIQSANSLALPLSSGDLSRVFLTTTGSYDVHIRYYVL